MQTELFLQNLLARAYGLDNAMLYPTSGGSERDKPVFRVQSADANYILRVYPPHNSRSDVVALTEVLRLLEQVDYPAERLIPAQDGAPLVTADDWRLVLTTLIEGIATDQSIPPFYELGAILGRLHALFRPDELVSRKLPVAERSMEAEMTMSLDDLLAVPPPIPAPIRPFREELIEAIARIDRCYDLPYVLIHNDFQPGNILRTPDGLLKVIDWDGAGRSPAILDLGYLISHVHPSGAVRPDAARIEALLAGYSQHYQLSPAELDRLADAIRFRPITYLTSDFAAYIASDSQPDPSYLDALAAYRSADEAAAIATKYIADFG